MYDAKELKEKELPKAGTIVKGKITEIKEGSFSDFFSKETLEKFDNREPTQPAIKVIIETENLDTTNKLIALPSGNEFHPNSSLGKWQKAYGKLPEVGDEVNLKYNNEGFIDLVL